MMNEERKIVEQIKSEVFQQIAKYFVFDPPKADNMIVYTKGHKGFLAAKVIAEEYSDGKELNDHNFIIRYMGVRPRDQEGHDEIIKRLGEYTRLVGESFNLYVRNLLSYINKHENKTYTKATKARSVYKRLAEAKALLKLFGVSENFEL